MLSFLIALGIAVLIPLFLLALVFDILMFTLALGWKVLTATGKIICWILGALGILITIPLFICILILL